MTPLSKSAHRTTVVLNTCIERLRHEVLGLADYFNFGCQFDNNVVMSGLVNSIRGVTATSERLRSDHILTLELFQATVDENGSLKEEVARLTARLAAEGLVTEDESADDKNGKKDSGAALVQKVLKQEKELTELRGQVKTLKAKGVQDDITITRLTKSNSSNEALKKQLDDMLKAEAERAQKDAARDKELNDAKAQVDLHDHNECLETITTLNNKMMKDAEEFKNSKQGIEDEVVKLTTANSNLMTTEKSLREENEDLKERLAKWETKYAMAMKTNDDALRAAQDKAFAAELELTSTHQQSLDLVSLQEELHAEKTARHELEIKNAELLQKLKEAQDALKEAKLQMPPSGNPLLKPATSSQDEAEGNGFFMTGSQSTPRLVETVGFTQVPAHQQQDSHFAQVVKLRKENKALRSELQAVKSERGTPLSAVGLSKGR